MRIETYLKILKIEDLRKIYQVIINEPLLDFEKTQIFLKKAISVPKIKSIQITTNKDKLNIYIPI